MMTDDTLHFDEEKAISDVLEREATRRSRGFPQQIPHEIIQNPDQLPLDTQVGGDHYKDMVIQPIEFSMCNRLNACQHTAIKYIIRKKGDTSDRLMDLDKAIHTLQIYKQMIEAGVAE